MFSLHVIMQVVDPLAEAPYIQNKYSYRVHRSIENERFSICGFYSTGPAKGDMQAGSVAEDGSVRGQPRGCAGSVCYSVEILLAAFAAQPQETHQDTSAPSSAGTGRHKEVTSVF